MKKVTLRRRRTEVAMPRVLFYDSSHRRTFARVIKEIRRARGMTLNEASAAMGMPRRSYQYFESGRARFNFAVVARFAAALDADPFAIVLAAQIAAPVFAVRVADNCLMALLMSAVAVFNDEAGDAAAALDARYLQARFRALASDLASEARAREAIREV